MITKHISRLFVISLLMFLFAACSTDTPAEPTENTDGGESGETAEYPAEIPVGVLFGLSGGVAVYGETQSAAVQLAFDEINESGYIAEGVTLVAVIEDSGGDGEQAIAAMGKVINEDNVVAVIGPTLSSSAFAADPIAQEAGIPVLGVSNTANGITDMGNFVFRNSLPEASVIPGTIEQSTAIFGLESVGILWGNDDDFTASGYDVFIAALEANGVAVSADETFARGDVDFNAQLTNIIAEEPDAIVVSALAQEAVPIITQARALGFDGPIIGGNGFNSPAIIEQAGEDAEGVIVGAAWNNTDSSAESLAFIEAYTEATGKAPDQFAAQAYTGAYLIATAIRDAGSADPAAIRDTLAAITDFTSPLGSFSFDENRNPVHDPVIQIIRGGSFVILTEDNATE